MRTRIEKLQALLPPDSAALVATPHHLGYLTGFPSGDSFLLVTQERSYFLTDFRYIEMAKNTVSGAECRMITRLGETVAELLKKQGIRKLYLETETTSLQFAGRLQAQLPSVNIPQSAELDGWLTDMRMVKDEGEVAKILQAQAIAEEGFLHIVEYIREGRTEREIALELEFYMRKKGAERMAFDTIVVSGKNSSLPHGIPTERAVRRGDFITMDFGAVVDGYHSDMTRTVAVGEVSEQQRLVYDTVLQAQLAALAVLKEGCRCADGDAAARGVIEAAGYGKCFGHATGHGVGIQVHEAPRLSAAAGEDCLRAGQVVTVEPGIYLEGQFGVRIEDMALITKDGYCNLTKSPKELIFING